MTLKHIIIALFSRANIAPSHAFVAGTERILLAEYRTNQSAKPSIVQTALAYFRTHVVTTGVSVFALGSLLFIILSTILNPSPEAVLNTITFSLDAL